MNENSSIFKRILIGIEGELRAVQKLKGAKAASLWWQSNFSHKYPEYIYDVVKERIIERGTQQTRD